MRESRYQNVCPNFSKQNWRSAEIKAIIGRLEVFYARVRSLDQTSSSDGPPPIGIRISNACLYAASSEMPVCVSQRLAANLGSLTSSHIA